MRKLKIITAFFILAILAFTGCEQPVISSPGIETSDKSILDIAITSANDLYSAHVVGSASGNVPLEAKTAFITAIESAQLVLDDILATQVEVDDQVTALTSATDLFNNAIIFIPGTLASLTNAISVADTLKAGTGVGTAVGQVSMAASVAFSDVIVAAEAVRDNPARTQDDIDSAISDLTAATVVFNAAIISTGSGDADTIALDSAIAAANALLNSTSVGTSTGQVSTDASSAYAGAIVLAQNASDSAISQAVVNAALTSLNSATVIFQDAIIGSGPVVLPTTLPIAPTLSSSDVISIYTSGMYADLPWTQATWDTNDFTEAVVNISGTDYTFKQHVMTGTAAFEIPATDIAGKTMLHLSYFTADASSIEVKVVEFLNGVWASDTIVEIVENITTTTGSWIEFEIDCSGLARTDNVKQLLFTGMSGTVFYDNMYFWGVPVDPAVPVITLSGDSTVTLTVGDSYIDAGATASDDVDGDITGSIVTVNPVDTAIADTYVVTYNVTDSDSNPAVEVLRTVVVEAPLADPLAAAPAPDAGVLNSATVFYSDPETPDATVNNYAAPWSSGFVFSEVVIDSNNALRYVADTHGAAAGIEFNSIDVSGKAMIHLDWYIVGDINQITLQFVGGAVAVEPVMTPVKGEWVSIDLPMSTLGGAVPNWGVLQQIGLTFYGAGVITDPDSRVYVDNLYFY